MKQGIKSLSKRNQAKITYRKVMRTIFISLQSTKSPLKLEVKFDLPACDGEVNAKKLDFWINKSRSIIKCMRLMMIGPRFN